MKTLDSREKIWYLYILRCCDNSLYTGITLDVDRRLREHNQKKGSRLVRARLPAVVVYREKCRTRSSALKRELFIKKLSHRQKLDLIR